MAIIKRIGDVFAMEEHKSYESQIFRKKDVRISIRNAAFTWGYHVAAVCDIKMKRKVSFPITYKLELEE